MRIDKKTANEMNKVYKPGMTAKKLAKAADVPLFKVHRYLSEELFKEEILKCRKRGLSYRQIARKLQIAHAAAHRVVMGLESE